jgi:hypothetical protein
MNWVKSRPESDTSDRLPCGGDRGGQGWLRVAHPARDGAVEGHAAAAGHVAPGPDVPDRAYGPSAVLSHRSAAALWNLRRDNRIIPPADEAVLREAGVARVYTPKDFEVSRIMGDIVDVVAEHHGVAAVS